MCLVKVHNMRIFRPNWLTELQSNRIDSHAQTRLEDKHALIIATIGVRDGGAIAPPIFRAVLDFIRAPCPKSTQICPNSVLIFKISPNSGGRAPQTPHFIPYYEYSLRIKRVCLHARIFRASKSVDSGNFRCHSGNLDGLPPLWKFPVRLWTKQNKSKPTSWLHHR